MAKRFGPPGPVQNKTRTVQAVRVLFMNYKETASAASGGVFTQNGRLYPTVM